jgi:hypothetical protein
MFFINKPTGLVGPIYYVPFNITVYTDRLKCHIIMGHIRDN